MRGEGAADDFPQTDAVVVTADQFPGGLRSEVPRERLVELIGAAGAGDPDNPVEAAWLAAAAMWWAY